MSISRPVPFRAGRGEILSTAVMPSPATSGPAVLLSDISVFQPEIADAASFNWSEAVIIRAMYGTEADGAWYGGQRRNLLLLGGAQFLGCYQYLTASEDAAVQARAFARLLGHLNPGEYPIADIEEGAGDQQARWQAWAEVIHGELGFAPGNYSGLNFAAAAGLTPVDWVAAYQTAEPAVPHLLWQFTDAYQVPGVGVADCSRFKGTIGELRALAYGGTTQPAPPANWTEQLVNTLPTLTQGAAGPDVRTAQGLLTARGHPVTIDGAYGIVTAGATRAFQAAAGITADSVFGPPTWTKALGR